MSSAQIQELMSEIAFQKVLLISIDENAADCEISQQEIRDEIRNLERRLKTLRRESLAPASTPRALSQHHTQSFPRSDTPREITIQQTTSSSDAASLRAYPGQEVLAPLGNTYNPVTMDLPSRKRTHSKVSNDLLGPGNNNQASRTSASLFNTRQTTPSTSSDDEDFVAFDREFFQLQKQAEERAEREKLDADLARSIQRDGSMLGPAYSSSASTPSASTTSAFDRLSGVRPSTSNAMYSSNVGPLSGKKPTFGLASQSSSGYRMKTEPATIPSNMKREPRGAITGSSSFTPSNLPRFKPETFSSGTPGTFREQSSDADDSDLEIIPSSAFRDNGRRSNKPDMNADLQKAMYGNKQMPDWMKPAGSDTLSRNGGLNSSLYSIPPYQQNGDMSQTMGTHGAGAGFDSQFGSMANMPGAYPEDFGGNMQNLGDGLGYTMNNLPNYDINQALFSGMSSAFGIEPLADMIRRATTMNPGDEIFGGNHWDSTMLDQASHIVNDPRKTNQEIKDLLLNIRPDVDLPPEDREGTPDGLVYPLYEHQKLALTWLKSMEEGTNKGGILADDMGLGKTISALALMLTRPSVDRARKTTLIVGPVALVRQWEREIRMKVKVSDRMSTHMVHGQTRKLSWDDLRTHDVVLTTYGTLGAEYRRLEKYHAKRKAEGGEIDANPMRKLFPLLGPKSLFYRIILDEAQCIKNKNTLSARACCHLKAIHRLCLTGTPMMNNVGELFSLIHFLRIKPYNEWSRFNDQFGMLTKGDATKRDVQGAMRKLQALLKAILLRRNKTSLIDGKPIVNLPPKTEEIQHVVFSDDERAFYSALETKTQLQFNRYMKAGTVGKNYSNVLVLLLRLRQACCHPHLIHDFEESATPADVSPEAMLELAKSLEPDVVARILAADDSFECPVCYDGVPNPSILIPCGHDTCSECLSKITDQAAQQNVANGDEGGAAYKCPSCRGRISMDKVIDYLTFKKVHKPEDINEEDVETASENSDSDSDSETDPENDDDDNDADSDGDLRDFVVPDDVETSDASTEDEVDEPVKKRVKFEQKVKPEQRIKSEQKVKSEENDWTKNPRKTKKLNKSRKKKGKKPKEHVSISMLKKEASKTAEGRRRYMRYLRKHWQPSAKLEKCVELVEKFQNDGQKTIIFSQFVSLLDLLQVSIEQKGWTCERYDGGMSADARNDAIVRFTDKPTTKLMLISLKAGNAGLNLVAASRVIILDPFWNPFIEMQAVDRAYRIGQQKSVEVHRILVASTVEDRIIELQEKKRKLVDAALDEGANKSLGRLDVRQLAFLFGVGDGN